jgi:hypothetical protein
MLSQSILPFFAAYLSALVFFLSLHASDINHFIIGILFPAFHFAVFVGISLNIFSLAYIPTIKTHVVVFPILVISNQVSQSAVRRVPSSRTGLEHAQRAYTHYFVIRHMFHEHEPSQSFNSALLVSNGVNNIDFFLPTEVMPPNQAKAIFSRS